MPEESKPAPDREGFDTFLSHNSKDKGAVRRLKERLVEHGLTVWFDEEQLRPGIPWQELLEAGIQDSRSIAVLVGESGIGPWENEEMRAALQLAVKDKRPVIPVLLPGAPDDVRLPLFLSNRTWVDLRPQVTAKKLELLIWGITNQKPSAPLGERGASDRQIKRSGEAQDDSTASAPEAARAEEDLLEELKRLPPAWFDELVFRLGANSTVAGKHAPQAERAMDLLTVIHVLDDGPARLQAEIQRLRRGRQ